MQMYKIKDLIVQEKTSEYFGKPEQEKFVTVSGRGKGVSQRKIGEGKTPVPFSGYRIKTGQLIYSRIGASDGAFGIVPDFLNNAVVSKDFPVFWVDETKVDKNYLLLFLCSKYFCQQAEQTSFGATMKRLREEALGEIQIQLPSLEEQRHIVQIFQTVRNRISMRQKEVGLFDTLIKAQFIEMFGDPIENPMGWKKLPLGEQCDIITGNTPSRKVPEYYGDYIEWIKSDNINTPNAILTTAEEYLSEAGLSVGRSVDAGAILMTCIAGSISCIGNVGIADRRVSFNQQINAIVPRENNTWYLYILFDLAKKDMQKTINKSLKGILSKSQLSAMTFIFPPIEKQNQFGVFVKQALNAKEEAAAVLEKEQIVYDGLLHQYYGMRA